MATSAGIAMSHEVPMLRILPSVEKRIRELRRCEVDCPMAKTLDQQLSEMLTLVAKIKEKYGLEMPDHLVEILGKPCSAEPDDVDGLELIRELLERFIKLNAYIDSLR